MANGEELSPEEMLAQAGDPLNPEATASTLGPTDEGPEDVTQERNFEDMTEEEIMALIFSDQLTDEEMVAAVSALDFEDTEDPFIGVPPEGVETVPQATGADLHLERGHPARQVKVNIVPQFRHSDIQNFFLSLAPEDRLDLQESLKQAGLIDNYDPEVLGEGAGSTAEAIGKVMAHANMTGKNFPSALSDFMQVKEKEEGIETKNYAFEPYEAPAWKELAQRAREGIEEQLGRDLKDWEVEMAANELGKLHREEYETDILEAKAYRNAQLQADEGEEDVTPEPVEGVQDHKAAYRAWFNERFKDELERKEDVEESQQQQARVARVTSVIKNLL